MIKTTPEQNEAKRARWIAGFDNGREPQKLRVTFAQCGFGFAVEVGV
jgi:hypothetical protein